VPVELEVAEPEPVEVPVELEVAEPEPVEVPVELEVAEPEPVEVVVDENGEEKVVENGDDDESKPYNPNIWVDGKDWDTDDEDGWVNPDNFNQLVLGKEVIEKEKQMEDMGVFIMTSDYAMQVPQFPPHQNLEYHFTNRDPITCHRRLHDQTGQILHSRVLHLLAAVPRLDQSILPKLQIFHNAQSHLFL
jgi:hypothetical protein